MEKKDVVRLATVGFLGLVCAALDFVSEANTIKISRTPPGDICAYISRNETFCYATAAATLFLLAALMFNDLITRAFRKKGAHPPSPALACLSFISLCTFVVAHILHSIYLYDCAKCKMVRRGVSAAAGVLSLVSVIFGIAYSYYYLLSANNSSVPQIEIAMSQQIPSAVTQDPVFVHEDTYIRRQFT